VITSTTAVQIGHVYQRRLWYRSLTEISLGDLVVTDCAVRLHEEPGILGLRFNVLDVLTCHGSYGIHGFPQAQQCEFSAIPVGSPKQVSSQIARSVLELSDGGTPQVCSIGIGVP
jgi:hypothetical protein